QAKQPTEPTEPTESGSTDASLAGRAKKPASRARWWAVGGAAVVVIALAAALIAYLGKQDADGTESAPGSGAASTGTATAGEATLTVGVSLEPTNLNIRSTAGTALDQVLLDNVYQPLVRHSDDGSFEPSLASRWEIADDGLTYTFTLFDGIVFSNGHVLDSEDVAWSILQVRDEQLVNSNLLAAVAAIEAPDPATVVFRLSQPYPDLLWALSTRAGIAIDQEAGNDLDSTAIGSGPYLLEQWKQGDSITLTRNDGYWGEAPSLAQVVIRYVPDVNASVTAFNAGDLDAVAPIDASLRDQVSVEGANFFVAEASDKFVLAFNNAAPPLDRLEVRQAIRYALDDAAFIAARGDVDRPLGGPIPPTDPGYEDLTGLYPRDLAKARELLAAAGYGDGLELTLTIPSFYSLTLPDLVTAQLAEVGITVTVQAVEFSAWLEDVYTNKDYQLSIVDHAETHDFGSWANPDYYFGYDNAEVQQLYADAVKAVSAEEADKLLAQAARLVSQDAAADWLFNFRQLVVTAPGVEGFPQAQINSRLNFAQISVAAGAKSQAK
ncbi:MAG: ABC transporter substrate-binding protein, partial [Bifidobacteriaceae bacterium]|nr:ABC transporter substrate-binding protein [Bifidobacteriaceae bacterium]